MGQPLARITIGLRRLYCLGTDSTQGRIPSLKLQYKGLFLDAAGTLIHLKKPPGVVYSEFAAQAGITVAPEEVSVKFKQAFRSWKGPGLKYVGDGRDFWAHVVGTATGSSSVELFESLYAHYGRGIAWELYPGTIEALRALRDEGVKIVVVSNFDTRLRGVLEDLGVAQEVDGVVVSAEVGYEKPDPSIFKEALNLVGLRNTEVVHVGNEKEEDVEGARSAGLDAWMFGEDVLSYLDIAEKMQHRSDRNT